MTNTVVHSIVYEGTGNSASTFASNSHKIAVDSITGRLWAVYVRQATATGGGETPYSQVFAAYSDDSGSTWTEERVSDIAYDQHHPGLAIDSLGQVHVVWTGMGFGANPITSNIQYRCRTTSWQAREAVTDEVDMQDESAIAIDTMGNVHVVWAGYSVAHPFNKGIQYRCRTTSWQAMEEVSSGTRYNQDDPSVAVDSVGRVHVVWSGGLDTLSDSIMYRQRTDSWQALELVAGLGYSEHQTRPSIAVDDTDVVHVVWDGTGWGENIVHFNIQYRQRTDSWQSQEAITDIAHNQIAPSIGISADGDPQVVWANHVPQVQFRRRASGSWQEQIEITEELYDNDYPGISARNDHIVWTGDTGGYTVFYGTLGEPGGYALWW